MAVNRAYRVGLQTHWYPSLRLPASSTAQIPYFTRKPSIAPELEALCELRQRELRLGIDRIAERSHLGHTVFRSEVGNILRRTDSAGTPSGARIPPGRIFIASHMAVWQVPTSSPWKFLTCEVGNLPVCRAAAPHPVLKTVRDGQSYLWPFSSLSASSYAKQRRPGLPSVDRVPPARWTTARRGSKSRREHTRRSPERTFLRRVRGAALTPEIPPEVPW